MLLEAMCLAMMIYGEARGEPLTGQIAVAEVVMERVRDPRWPNDVCDVVQQKHQFPGYYTVKRSEVSKWSPYVTPALLVLQRNGGSRSLGANHYYASAGASYIPAPSWAKGMRVVTTIGNHTFLTDRTSEPDGTTNVGGEVSSVHRDGGTGVVRDQAEHHGSSPPEYYIPHEEPTLYGSAEVG